jgi:hypothetical protein
VVHAAAIAATSHQLDALINGGMKESETRCARIKDVKMEDFIRFCEYAYRGDYTVPPWEESPPNPSCASSNNQQIGEVDTVGLFGASCRKKKSKKAQLEPEPETASLPQSPAHARPLFGAVPHPQPEIKLISRVPLRTQFNNRSYSIKENPRALILQHFEPKSNSSVNQNFTPVMLAHARLYCFAHVRLISSLKALTLSKLHKTLLSFTLYAERIGDIIELAKFAYSTPDLPDRSDDGNLDDLRKLVVDYIVCEIDTIGKHDEFLKYMEEGGEFVGDFWRLAKNYMA